MTFALFSLVTAQPSAAQTPPARLDPSMVSFFSGDWKGEGAFANVNRGKAKVTTEEDRGTKVRRSSLADGGLASLYEDETLIGKSRQW
jgi:hypothetical protein